MNRMCALRPLITLSAFTLVLAACSGGSDSTTSAETPRADEPTTITEPPAPKAPADPAAAEAEVRANFSKVFDSTTPQADALVLVQDAAEIAPTLEQAQAASPGGHRTVAITDVTFVSDTEASVTFDIVLEGATLLPGFIGGAVFEDGVWMVSRKTNCDLAALAGFSCP